MARRRKPTLATSFLKAFAPPAAARRRPRRAVTKSLLSPAAVRAAAGFVPPVGRKGPSAPPGAGTWRQGRFAGAAGSRSYRVYVPAGLRKTSWAPLVVALHGCGQSGVDFAAGTRFNDLADKHHFVVVYPEQSGAHNGQRCWNWFRPGHQARDAGEPAILAGIVRSVVAETRFWRIDPERIYAAGISAGGAMAVVLGATYPELFAAVGVHSAPPYRSATGPADALAAMRGTSAVPPVTTNGPVGQFRLPMPPMVIFHGTADGTVRPGNAQRIADQWLAYRRAPSAAGPAAPAVGPPRSASVPAGRPTSTRSRRAHQVTRWYAGGRKVLELWLVQGLGHAWSGGSADGSYSDPRGPRATTEMWKFFSANRSRTAAAALGG